MNIVKSYSTKRLSGGQVARNVLLEAKKERGFLAFFIVSFDPSTSSSSEEEEQQNGGSGDFSEPPDEPPLASLHDDKEAERRELLTTKEIIYESNYLTNERD